MDEGVRGLFRGQREEIRVPPKRPTPEHTVSGHFSAQLQDVAICVQKQFHFPTHTMHLMLTLQMAHL